MLLYRPSTAHAFVETPPAEVGYALALPLGVRAVQAYHVLAQGCFGPEHLKVLYDAFDRAWEVLAPSVGENALAIEVTRQRLANIILKLGSDGTQDAEQIRRAALAVILDDP